MFFKKKNKDVRCYVLYFSEFDRSKTGQLYQFILDYFDSSLGNVFKYLGFYSENYNLIYGTFESVQEKIKRHNWNEIVNLTFEDGDARKEKQGLSIQFEICKPNQITIVLTKSYENFKLVDFVNALYVHFKVIYGFAYLTENVKWATAYADGAFEHVKDKELADTSVNALKAWQTKSELIQKGYIRGVFDINLLSKAHLSFLIDGRPLEWHIENEDWGRVFSINPDIYIWQLSDEEIKLSRNSLDKSEILLRF
ncbi:hypothetical protein [Filimonas effusa]|uniref:Uncharacterized protein n=1 Tax=Filimonas effusa TaxID=2508721 RepID=A0A4Q1D9T8_9BACT|nr:hypothetical protein [Filimonas effusa]RXK86137.1 hypothetical protein ESB13_04825 [Filimonas effusa]